MSRMITIGAAQSGPVSRQESRVVVVERLLGQMREAHRQGCDLIVYTEVALTAFFPHWWIENEEELDSWFEREMPGPETQPLFDEARRLGIGFHLGYAELAFEEGRKRRFNSSVLVGKDGLIIGKFRKMHLPGHYEHRPNNPFQNLEKRYFEFGNEPFRTWQAFGGVVGMCICNDRRWPEVYREAALRGAEMMLIGYNTPLHYPPAPEHDHLQPFHNHLVMQAGAYQNGMWVVGVAKAGREEGCDLIGQSCVIAPTGEIVAMCSTLGDELVVAVCDLDRCAEIRANVFNFRLHRRPDRYPLLSATSDLYPIG